MPLVGLPQLSAKHHVPLACAAVLRGDVPGGSERPSLPPAEFVSRGWTLMWSSCHCQGTDVCWPLAHLGEKPWSGVESRVAGGRRSPASFPALPRTRAWVRHLIQLGRAGVLLGPFPELL